MKTLKVLGFFLKQKRLAAGYSQSQVAKELGYTTAQFISNWERGLITPPLPTLKYLCGYYGITEKSIEDMLLSITLEKWQTTKARK